MAGIPAWIKCVWRKSRMSWCWQIDLIKKILIAISTGSMECEYEVKSQWNWQGKESLKRYDQQFH